MPTLLQMKRAIRLANSRRGMAFRKRVCRRLADLAVRLAREQRRGSSRCSFADDRASPSRSSFAAKARLASLPPSSFALRLREPKLRLYSERRMVDQTGIEPVTS